MCVYVCVCVRASARTCVRACVCVFACVRRFVCVYQCVAPPCTMLSTSFYDDIRTKEASQKRICDFFVHIEHLLRTFFVGIRKVQERVSERIEKVPGRYVDGTVKASLVAERGRQRAIGNSVVVCVCVCVCVCICV